MPKGTKLINMISDHIKDQGISEASKRKSVQWRGKQFKGKTNQGGAGGINEDLENAYKSESLMDYTMESGYKIKEVIAHIDRC